MKDQIQELMLNPWIMYTTMILSQIGFSYFRSWNIREVSQPIVNKTRAHLSWFLYGIVYVAGLSTMIASVFMVDLIGISVWFASSHIGMHLSIINKGK